MSPTNTDIYRFSHALHVAETTPKSLRKWLQNPEVALIFSGHEQGWKQFNFADLLVLATMRKLIDFGLSVGEANDFATHLVGPLARGSLTSRNLSPSALVKALEGFKAVIFRAEVEGKDDPWRVRIDPPDADRPPPAAVFLTIDLHQVASRALQRLIELEPRAAIEFSAPLLLVADEG
jgi:hypothetical protein